MSAASAALLAITLTPLGASAQLTGVAFTSVDAGTTGGCALSTAQALYCWGANNFHQLQSGNTTQSDVPALVDLSSLIGSATIRQVATGDNTTCVLDSSGNVLCWGYGGQGEVGDGHFLSSTVPVAVSLQSATGSVTTLVGGGTNSFCVLTSTSQVWCWGDNLHGQIGNGTTTNVDVPTQVSTNGVLNGLTITSLAGWSETFCVVASTGAAFCWGSGTSGALGNNAYLDSDVPVAVDLASLPNGDAVRQIAPSNSHTCLLDANKDVWCWGNNDGGVNGLGDPDGATNSGESFATPQKVTALHGLSVSSVSSSSTESCALTGAGALYCWGADPIGDGASSGSVLSPELINGGDINQRTIADVSEAPYETCAVDLEGSLYCWGVNSSGEIGDGSSGGSSDSVSSEEIAVSPSATTIITVPNTPRDVIGTGGVGSIDVTWAVPYSDGGSAITGYTATASLSSENFTCSTDQTGTGCTIDGLTKGDTYDVSVVATNSVGNSINSQAGDVTLPTVPDAPSITAVPVTTTSATVQWSAPAFDGGLDIAGYTATAVVNSNSFSCQGGSSDTSCTIDALTEGTTYSVSVIATNADGPSVPSATFNATPGSVPSVPQDVGATAGDASIAATWQAPSSNGDTPITGYVATATVGSTPFTCTTNSAGTGCTITGLTNGTAYSVTVAAINEAGNSPAAGIGTYTPVTNPDAPVLASATAGNGQITVVWSAGASNGGSPITGFTASAGAGASITTCGGGASATSCVITGLINGTTYAVNAVTTTNVGNSVSSNTLHATPATIPGAPIFGALTPGSGSVVVHWSAPSNTGGFPVTKYTVVASPGGASCVTATLNCTFTKLSPTTAYSFKAVATTSIGTGPSVTSYGVYPFAPKGLGVEPASSVVSVNQSFVVIVAGATADAKVTIATTNIVTASCTADASGQCVVAIKQPKNGTFRLIVKSGTSAGTGYYYVPLLVAPGSVPHAKAEILRVYYCSPSAVVVLTVAGKSYSTRASTSGAASVTITIAKAGTYTITTTVAGVILHPTNKIKAT